MNHRDYVGQSLKTILEMLRDRGIETAVSPDGAQELIGSNQNYFEFSIDRIKIVYYLMSKFKWTALQKSFEDGDADEKPYDLYILVVKEKPTQNNLKFIHATKLDVQIFDIRELQFNISKHSLNPKFELIRDAAEVERIIHENSLKNKTQLPIILRTDPMARYLNLRTGDVVRVTRVSPTAGEYVGYRCCL